MGYHFRCSSPGVGPAEPRRRWPGRRRPPALVELPSSPEGADRQGSKKIVMTVTAPLRDTSKPNTLAVKEFRRLPPSLKRDFVCYEDCDDLRAGLLRARWIEGHAKQEFLPIRSGLQGSQTPCRRNGSTPRTTRSQQARVRRTTRYALKRETGTAYCGSAGEQQW